MPSSRRLSSFPGRRGLDPMARAAHAPDPVTRRQVEAMAGYGVPEHEIAGIVGIDAKTLRKHYREELALGHTKANVKVAENLYRKACGEGRESVTAAIFWLKTRARWKETQVNEIGGIPGQPIEQVHAIRRVIVDATAAWGGEPMPIANAGHDALLPDEARDHG